MTSSCAQVPQRVFLLPLAWIWAEYLLSSASVTALSEPFRTMRAFVFTSLLWAWEGILSRLFPDVVLKHENEVKSRIDCEVCYRLRTSASWHLLQYLQHKTGSFLSAQSWDPTGQCNTPTGLQFSCPKHFHPFHFPKNNKGLWSRILYCLQIVGQKSIWRAISRDKGRINALCSSVTIQ